MEVENTTDKMSSNLTKAEQKDNSPANTDIMEHIEIYGITFLVPVGLILNMASLLVFCKSDNYSTSVGLHLKCLAVADSLLILAQFLVTADDHWEEMIGIPAISTTNDFFCKIGNYLFIVGYLTSPFVLASATVERFLCITYPLKIKQWNINLITKILMGLFFLLSFSVATIALFAFKVQPDPFDKEFACMVLPKYEALWNRVNIATISVIANLVCGNLIFMFSILIAVCLFKQKRKRMDMGNSSSEISKKEAKITLMLLIVSIMFVLLRYPKVTIEVIMTTVNPSLGAILFHWSRAMNVLVVLNHSINFIIYIIFLKPFRQKFIEMFICCRSSPTD